MLVRLFKIVRIDYDSLIHKWSRGFPGPGFFRKIRHRPSVPLCAVLRRRLIQYDEKRLKDQKNKGRYLVSMLQEGIECPGSSAGNHVYWVFPVCIPWKAEFIDTLRSNGFDATGKHSMSVVCLPEGRGLEPPHQANRLLDQIVYLPFYPEIPFNEITRMGGIASSFIKKHA